MMRSKLQPQVNKKHIYVFFTCGERSGVCFAAIMPSLTAAFAFYGSYHANGINQLIHVICVPAIYTTALAFLTKVQLPVALPLALRSAARALGEGGSPAGTVTLALPLAALYASYYLSLTLPRRPLLGLGAAALALGALPLAHGALALGPRAMPVIIGVHVVSWLAQFYGHAVHEGRSPALLDNLWRAWEAAAVQPSPQAACSHTHTSHTHAPHARAMQRRSSWRPVLCTLRCSCTWVCCATSKPRLSQS